MKNVKALWLAKHWGLGIGVVLTVTGLSAAAPGYMVTWRVSARTDTLFGEKLTQTSYTRLHEALPDGFKAVGVLPDSHELKGLGVSAMILGSSLMLACAVGLKREYARQERTNWALRQSEFDLDCITRQAGIELANHEAQFGLELDKYDIEKQAEIDKWKIDLDTQGQISNMLQPKQSYYAKEEEDQPRLKQEPEFSRTTPGFLAWLQQEKFAKLGRQFEVRWCCQQSFPGEKLKAEEVRGFVGELSGIGQAEWLDDAKNQFRLLLD